MQNGRRFKTAFILGAGLGLRLRPLTEHCPKPLLEFSGRPVISYVMDHLLSTGIDRFIVNTHHCPEKYLEKFPDGKWRGMPVIFRHEPILLETGGGLKNIEDLLAGEKTILCCNGDILANFPLQGLREFHELKKPEATLVLRSSGPVLNVSLDEQNEICDIRHVLKKPGLRKCLFTGIYAVETSLLKFIEAGKVESIISIFIQRIRESPGSIAGIVIDEGDWQDIGSLQIYESLKSNPAGGAQ
jgi:mannose-1-phosphate guanylyltransferase